jgi:pimeloyl-ACP methyl ester carboxylesterase
LIGHDWGAVAVHALAACAPERFARTVALAIPPVRPPNSARAVIAELPLLVRQLRYYRALFLPWMRSREYAREQSGLLAPARRPLLYLHGEDDGCIGAAFALRRARLLPPGSEFELVPGCGHFLQLERPDHVGERIARFLAPAGAPSPSGRRPQAPGEAPASPRGDGDGGR